MLHTLLSNATNTYTLHKATHWVSSYRNCNTDIITQLQKYQTLLATNTSATNIKQLHEYLKQTIPTLPDTSTLRDILYLLRISTEAQLTTNSIASIETLNRSVSMRMNGYSYLFQAPAYVAAFKTLCESAVNYIQLELHPKNPQKSDLFERSMNTRNAVKLQSSRVENLQETLMKQRENCATLSTQPNPQHTDELKQAQTELLKIHHKLDQAKQELKKQSEISKLTNSELAKQLEKEKTAYEQQSKLSKQEITGSQEQLAKLQGSYRLLKDQLALMTQMKEEQQQAASSKVEQLNIEWQQCYDQVLCELNQSQIELEEIKPKLQIISEQLIESQQRNQLLEDKLNNPAFLQLSPDEDNPSKEELTMIREFLLTIQKLDFHLDNFEMALAELGNDSQKQHYGTKRGALNLITKTKRESIAWRDAVYHEVIPKLEPTVEAPLRHQELAEEEATLVRTNTELMKINQAAQNIRQSAQFFSQNSTTQESAIPSSAQIAFNRAATKQQTDFFIYSPLSLYIKDLLKLHSLISYTPRCKSRIIFNTLQATQLERSSFESLLTLYPEDKKLKKSYETATNKVDELTKAIKEATGTGPIMQKITLWETLKKYQAFIRRNKPYFDAECEKTLANETEKFLSGLQQVNEQTKPIRDSMATQAIPEEQPKPSY